MRVAALLIAVLLIVSPISTAAAYTYQHNLTDIENGDITTLNTQFNVSYINNASIKYTESDIGGVFSINGTEYTNRRPIYINNTGSVLNDYQVGYNSTYDSNMKIDFSDIVYTYSNNTIIPYWHEKIENSSYADTWLNVSIPASTNLTIYEYYGNAAKTTESNGDGVFILFDQFEGSSLDANKWTETNSPTVTVSNSILKVYSTDSVWRGVLSSSTFSDDIILMSNSKFTTTTASNKYRWMGFSDNEDRNGNGVLYTVHQGGTGGLQQSSQTSNGAYQYYTVQHDQQFHDYDIKWKSGEAKFYVDDVLKSTHTSYLPSGSLYAGMGFYGGSDYYIEMDWIALREYAASEPVVSVGAEEVGGGVIEITPQAQGTTNGTTITLTESQNYNTSSLNLTGFALLSNIKHLIDSESIIDTANISINYSTAHAVLKTPANNHTFYKNDDIVLTWDTNPQGTEINYYVAYDPNFYSIVSQGTTTTESINLDLNSNTYYWKVSVNGEDTETRQFIKSGKDATGQFNFTAYDEQTFNQITNFDVKLYNSTWFMKKGASGGHVNYNSSEVNTGEYTALINASGYYPRWYVVNSPSNVSVYLPNSSNTVRTIDFNLMDYTNQFNYPDTRLIVTKTTSNNGIITVSDRYFDVSGSNPVYLLDYNNYILTLENTAGYQKSIGSYLPIANAEVSLVVGEIEIIPDTTTHGGFNYNITKANNSVILKWTAPTGSLNNAFEYNITVNNNTVYDIQSNAPYGTATYFLTNNDTHIVQLYANTTGGIIDHQEYYRPQNQLVDFNVSDFWYNIFGMFILIIMGLLFSFRSAKTGAIITAFGAVALSAIGMLHISATVLSLAVVVALMSKLSEAKQT